MLTTCEACGHRLSVDATACPDCGHPNDPERARERVAQQERKKDERRRRARATDAAVTRTLGLAAVVGVGAVALGCFVLCVLPDVLVKQAARRTPRAAAPAPEVDAETETTAAEPAPPPAPAPIDPCGRRPTLGSWDGELTGARTWLRHYSGATWHDPGSIDVSNCSEPVLTEDLCWVSTCIVRGTNAFGAKVATEWRFYAIDGAIIAGEEL